MNIVDLSGRGALHWAAEAGSETCVQELIRSGAYVDNRDKQGNTALLVRAELPLSGRMTSVAYKRVSRKNWWKKLGAIGWYSI